MNKFGKVYIDTLDYWARAWDKESEGVDLTSFHTATEMWDRDNL